MFPLHPKRNKIFYVIYLIYVHKLLFQRLYCAMLSFKVTLDAHLCFTKKEQRRTCDSITQKKNVIYQAKSRDGPNMTPNM